MEYIRQKKNIIQRKTKRKRDGVWVASMDEVVVTEPPTMQDLVNKINDIVDQLTMLGRENEEKTVEIMEHSDAIILQDFLIQDLEEEVEILKRR